MLCGAPVIRIVFTFRGFTVNADSPAGMRRGALKHISAFFLLNKALATGLVAAAGMSAPHEDIALTAEILFVVDTVFNRTF